MRKLLVVLCTLLLGGCGQIAEEIILSDAITVSEDDLFDGSGQAADCPNDPFQLGISWENADYLEFAFDAEQGDFVPLLEEIEVEGFGKVQIAPLGAFGDPTTGGGLWLDASLLYSGPYAKAGVQSVHIAARFDWQAICTSSSVDFQVTDEEAGEDEPLSYFFDGGFVVEEGGEGTGWAGELLLELESGQFTAVAKVSMGLTH